MEKRKREEEELITRIKALPQPEPHTKSPPFPPDPIEIIEPYIQRGFKFREYQKEGIRFMSQLLVGKNPFVFLGDEMGLGKTIQILSTCLYIHALQKVDNVLLRGVFVVVLPRPIIPNFVNNGREFLGYPSTHFVEYTGYNRKRVLRKSLKLLARAHKSTYPYFIFTNFETVRVDGPSSPLFELPVTCLIIDEAHQIRNEKTQTNMAMRNFNTEAYLFSTATPVCNSIKDLMGYIAVYGDEETTLRLRALLKAKEHEEVSAFIGEHMVRRTTSILKGALPEKKEMLLPVIPSNEETSIIDMLCDMVTKIWEQRNQCKDMSDQQVVERMQRMNAMVLVNINRLRQACITPFLLLKSGIERDQSTVYKLCCSCYHAKPDVELDCGHHVCTSCVSSLSGYIKRFSDHTLLKKCCPLCSLIYRIPHPHGTSSKFFYAIRVLHTMLESPGSILVFSEFKQSLNLFGSLCKKCGIDYALIHGSLTHKERADIIDSFRKPTSKIRVLLLTIGVGGVGLNLQVASKAIILDPTWDPKKEEQAIGRIYRLGQDKPVKVIRLSYLDAVEDAIRILQAKKFNEAKVINEGARYGLTSKGTVEQEFHDRHYRQFDDSLGKFMESLKEIVEDNYKKRVDGEREEELKAMRRKLAEKIQEEEEWLIQDWDTLFV